MTKQEFVNIIEKLRKTNELQDQIDDLIQKSGIEMDFLYSYGYVIAHEDIVVNLLEEIMDDEFHDILYFIYELDYGRDYKPGCVTDDGKIIDLSNTEKLFDYLEDKKNAKKEL